MPNKWLAHIKKTMKQMKARGTYKKGMGLKQVILAAKKTWHKKGGGSCMTGGENGPVDDPSAQESGTTGTGTTGTTGTGTIGTTGTEREEGEGAAGGRRKTRRRRHSRRR